MKKLVTLCVLGIFGTAAYAHKGHDSTMHDKHVKSNTGDGAIRDINKLYERDAKPIFQRSCFNCHSQNVNFPWYYKIPGAKQLIDSDIAEAREHLDFTKGFPFGGHGNPREDLEAIETAIKDKSMPPFRYWVMNWKSRLSADEQSIILNWVSESKKLLDVKKK